MIIEQVKTMTFLELNNKIKEKFNEMQKGTLYRSDITGDELWEMYLKGFSKEEDPVYRDPNSTTHTCNNDKNFIRRYGNIVSINEDGTVTSMFDIEVEYPYQNTIKNLAKCLAKAPVAGIFVEDYLMLDRKLNYQSVKRTQTEFQLGHKVSYKYYTKQEVEQYGVVEEGRQYIYHHFHVVVDKKHINFTSNSRESIEAFHRDNKQVFERGMKEISFDTLELVRDLIVQGSLLDGNTYLNKVTAMLNLKKEYDSFSGDKSNWCWLKSYNLPYAKFRNEVIGTLCQDLSEGMEINQACLAWNKKVDSVNFMRAKAPVTKKQIENDEKQIQELGYIESLTSRRFAQLSDINVSEIKYKNIDGKQIVAGGLFDKVKQQTSTRHKKAEFDGVETVSIEKFIKDILPSCTTVSLFLENKHENNLVALITGQGKNMFKWSNPFSWTYSNNLTGTSLIKETVKSKGGNVTGELLCRLAWNEKLTNDASDLDLWCTQPDRESIGYNTGFRKDIGNKFSSCRGQLDLDDRGYDSTIHVENIYFESKKHLKKGNYVFKVNQFSPKNSQGFTCEIEFDGNVYTYVYDRPVVGWINVAMVNYDGANLTIQHYLPEMSSNKTLWNLQTGEFHKCNLICNSPNHWGENSVGNLHYFFMLDGCKSDIALRSYHPEFLNSELYEYRKTLDYLSNTIMLEPTEKQLCGVGFNSTIDDEVVLKLEGSHKRIVKVKIK